ncbi:MAG TPA: hypothetical protein VD862_00010 [Candidatus Paceibacterota bacterium]|nr:hypothetical protein [Candidatus Paceibacterota bacterium]
MQEPENITNAPEHVPGRLIVTFKSIMNPKSRNELLKSIGAEIQWTTDDPAVFVIRVRPGTEENVLNVLRGAPGVQSAQHIIIATPLGEPAADSRDDA